MTTERPRHPRHPLRLDRRPSRLLTAVTLLAASLAACTVVSDEPPGPSLTAPEVFYLRPKGDKAGTHDKMPYSLRAEDGAEPGVRTLTADVSKGAEGTVMIRKYGGCKGSSTHVTCEVDGDYSNWADAPRAKVVAVKGAEVGDSAVVTYTYTTKGGKKLTARTRFVVGEPVVEALAPEFVKGIRPGSELSAPLVVRNSGEVPVKGLGVELAVDSMDFEEKYSNCRYPEVSEGRVAVCEFPELTIDPGETVSLGPAPRMRTPETDMYVSYGKDVWALDMGPGHYGQYPKGGDFGDGPKLEVTTSDTTKGAFIAGGGSTYVVQDTYADYQVSGVDLHGDPGDERTFDIEVRNNGPADAGPSSEVVFSPPLGATVLKEPMEEIDEDVFEPYCDNNGYAYTCAVGRLEPGKTRSFEFTLRLGEPGEGFLSLENLKPASPWDVGNRDPDATNDEAAVRVLPD